MLKAIFYKEWIKTRVYILVAFLMTLGMTGWTVLRIARVARMQGVGHLWEILIGKDTVFVENLTYLPLVLGLVLAVVQFVPEMMQKRLKLTLHLPYPRRRMIVRMLMYGAAVLGGMFLVAYAVLFFYLQSILASELVSRILLTSLPWFICGFNVYFLAAWVCLEPTWRRRFVNILITIGVVSVYFLSPAPQAYDSFLPAIVIYAGLTLLFPLLSVERFREGRQD